MRDREAYDGLWWMVDHYKSDASYHTYCNSCYQQIPEFLVRHAQKLTHSPDLCEGCGRRGHPNDQEPHHG